MSKKVGAICFLGHGTHSYQKNCFNKEKEMGEDWNNNNNNNKVIKGNVFALGLWTSKPQLRNEKCSKQQRSNEKWSVSWNMWSYCMVILLKYCKENVSVRHNINIFGFLFCLERTKLKIELKFSFCKTLIYL